jgi:hypothetical protein
VKSCNDYMGLIDGSADPREHPIGDLADHLQTCNTCADYRTAATRIRALLNEFRTALSTPDPTDLALKSVESRISSSRRQLFWSLILIAACIAAPFGAMVAGRALPLGGVLSFLSVGLLSLALPWKLLRKQSVLTKLGRRKSDFYQNWRHELQRELLGIIASAVFASLFSVTFLFLAAFVSFPPPGNFVVLGVAILMGVGALHALLVEMRDLRNELALVGEAGA